MNQERRDTRFDLLVISSDVLWCKFVRNTMRRTDHILEVTSLSKAEECLKERPFDIIFFSNELVPRSMSEVETFLSWCPESRVVVLCSPHDAELHLSRKHLARLGIEAEERPEEGKALRRIIKHCLPPEAESQQA